jgi:predicted nucleic acid-binding protein
MQIADANYLLRYVLNDVEEQASEAKAVLDSNTVLLSVEVIAEVVYVLVALPLRWQKTTLAQLVPSSAALIQGKLTGNPLYILFPSSPFLKT